MDGQTNVLSATPNKPQATVDETAVQAAVGALMKTGRGAKIERNNNGEVTKVSCFYTKITDAEFVHFKAFPNLTNLSVVNCPKVTGDGLVQLRGLTKLQTLDLEFLGLTDAKLVHLKEMNNLQKLSINFTKVTDAGLVHLKGLSNLNVLKITGTRITSAGDDELRQALPNCEIER